MVGGQLTAHAFFSLSFFRRPPIDFSLSLPPRPDASIWVHQFVKAMRDERGEPLPNAHLIGFFRRICK
jgi:hypothetical protein